jgi:ABC-type spermidine/putrescine transport system permease subunit I
LKGLFGNRGVIAALVLPGLAVLVFALVVPIGFSAWYSFTDWAGFGAYNRIGLENYREILTADPVFWRSLLNALILMLVTIFIQNPIAFALAALLAHLQPHCASCAPCTSSRRCSPWWSWPSCGSTSSTPLTGSSTSCWPPSG